MSVEFGQNNIYNVDGLSIGENVKIGHNNIFGKNITIGDNVVIGHNNVFLDEVTIGNGTKVEYFVLLKNKTIIGENCYVDSYFRSSGDNEIGNNVTLRFGSTIARYVFIEDDVFIAPNVMTIYSKHTGERGTGTYIRYKAFIGTAAVIAPNVTVGEEVVIGAQSYVAKDCTEKGIYVGVPARKIR
jgi:acetyltransferase-like isoleucine patch superfamily enzyme